MEVAIRAKMALRRQWLTVEGRFLVRMWARADCVRGVLGIVTPAMGCVGRAEEEVMVEGMVQVDVVDRYAELWMQECFRSVLSVAGFVGESCAVHLVYIPLRNMW